VEIRRILKIKVIAFARRRLVCSDSAMALAEDVVYSSGEGLDTKALTIGFSRRLPPTSERIC